MKSRLSLLVVWTLVLAPSGWMASSADGAPDSGASVAGAPAKISLSDGEILAIYDQTNTFDIETGRMAEERGATEEVRALGRMVVSDHTAVRDKASRLGVELGIAASLPAARAAAAEEHANSMASLQGLTGADFDRAYLRHEIRFHSDAIAAVQAVLIPSASSPALKQMMAEILPGFQHHLDETVRVAKKLGFDS
jgi:putative membrane protein